MPKKRSIKTSSPSDFEPKRKNPISLGSDSNIDNDLFDLQNKTIGQIKNVFQEKDPGNPALGPRS